MPSAAEECCEPSGNRQGISHCLESGHPVLKVYHFIASVLWLEGAQPPSHFSLVVIFIAPSSQETFCIFCGMCTTGMTI